MLSYLQITVRTWEELSAVQEVTRHMWSVCSWRSQGQTWCRICSCQFYWCFLKQGSQSTVIGAIQNLKKVRNSLQSACTPQQYIS